MAYTVHSLISNIDGLSVCLHLVSTNQQQPLASLSKELTHCLISQSLSRHTLPLFVTLHFKVNTDFASEL